MGIAAVKVEFMNRDEAEKKAYLEDPLVFHGKISSGTASAFLHAIKTEKYDLITW